MKKMKIVSLLIITFAFILPHNISLAETKQDCSQYSSDTIVGQYDKWRCKKGKPPRDKFSLKKLNPFKKKNWTPQKKYLNLV